MMMNKQSKPNVEQSEQPNSPPWPEWCDAFINNYTWTRPTAKHSVNPAPSASKMKVVAVNYEPEECYDDPAGLVEMPSNIHVHCWKRPQQISPDTTYIVEPEQTPLDLVTHNRHLLGFEIMRSIMSSINCLVQESFYRPFPIEFQSDEFTATGGSAWKPWHHVYSLTLAGKGQIHKPQYNPYGKYAIRLFFLGKWRRILIDDRLPMDDQGQILLPVSHPNNLWLPLLSKALLRVACLSWLPSSHCVDFSVIHCLTGWIQTQVPCKGCSMYHLWCLFCQLMPTTEEVVSSPGCCKTDQEFWLPQEKTTDLSAVGSRAILAIISRPGTSGIIRNVRMALDMVTHCKGEKERFAREHPHLEEVDPLLKPMSKDTNSVASVQTVLICNVRYDSEQPTPLWKQYRWNEWAYNKGIISEIPYKPVRNVQIYNPLEACLESTTDIGNAGKGERWLDFEMFVHSVRILEVYYKPSYFKYSLRAWSDADLLLPPHVAEDVIIKTRKKSLTKEKGGGDAKITKSKSPKTELSEKSIDPSSKSPSTKNTPKGKTDKGKGKDDKSKVEEDWPKSLKKSSFFYWLTDSMDKKEMLVTMSVYSPEKTPYAIVFIGRFDWHSPSVAPIIERLSTTATSGQFFILQPGMRVFRVWHQFSTPYFCLQVYSNTNFQCGSKMFIQKSMTCDSISYKFYGKEISSSFEQLLAAPQGGAEHGRAFQQVMSSLGPPQLSTQLPWPQWFNIHTELVETFEDSLTEMLIESIHHPEDIYQTIQAFQRLFLNPVFGMKTLKSIKPELYECIMEQRELQRQEELLQEQELREQSALAMGQKGQKSGKSTKKSIATPKSKTESKPPKTKEKADKDKIKAATQGETLRNLLLCKEKNLLINDPNHAILLLKKMVSKVPHLRYLYPFNFEDDIKMVYRDYTGEIHTTERWVVLIRFTVNIHCTEPVPCSLHFWAPVKCLVLRLINNDTEEEILPLGFIENSVAYLTRNTKGYTVCVYGVTPTVHATSVPWRLRSMGMRENDCLHKCEEELDRCTNTHINPPEQHQESLYGFYLPNKQNIIARCLLNVFADVTVLLRFRTSHRYTRCRVTVTDEAGDVVADSSGTGNVMITSLNLKGREGGVIGLTLKPSGSPGENEDEHVNPVVYWVTATVFDDSWPLEPSQILAMLYYKEHLPAILLSGPERFLSGEKTSISEKRSSGRTGRFSTVQDSRSKTQHSDLTNFENIQNKPSWSLTLVTDLKKEMPVTLHLDTSLYDTLNELKATWETLGFDLNKCSSLRQDFLGKLTVESEDNLSEETIFKLKPKKLDELTALHGRKVSEKWLQDYIPSLKNVHSSHTIFSNMSRRTFNTMSDYPQPSVTRLAKSFVPGISTEPSNSTIRDGSVHIETEGRLDHTNVMVQQTEIHKALLNIREKTMAENKEKFKETSILRDQILSRINIAKADHEAEKTKSETKKEQKDKDTKGKKTSDTKGKKTSLAGTQKTEGGKGKKK